MQAISVTGMRSPSMINPEKQLLKEKSTNLVVITFIAILFFAPVVVPSDPVIQTRIICFHKFCFSLTYLVFSCFFGLGFDRCLCNLTTLVTGTSTTLSPTINFLRVGFLVAVAANSNWVLISPLSVIFVCGVYRVYKHIQYAHNPPAMIPEAPSNCYPGPKSSTVIQLQLSTVIELH
ncbi:hypothetical protein M0R45_016495 [Rubus argutus]|uniref:Uncharacterized protein n=1 Tax=Rubus argutus TaxID=59490 RepID=A0AAW1XV80_RUBAR